MYVCIYMRTRTHTYIHTYTHAYIRAGMTGEMNEDFLEKDIDGDVGGSTQFTCFTSKKVQIMTPEELQGCLPALSASVASPILLVFIHPFSPLYSSIQ
jgi:hypothetical protein